MLDHFIIGKQRDNIGCHPDINIRAAQGATDASCVIRTKIADSHGKQFCFACRSIIEIVSIDIPMLHVDYEDMIEDDYNDYEDDFEDYRDSRQDFTRIANKNNSIKSITHFLNK